VPVCVLFALLGVVLASLFVCVGCLGMRWYVVCGDVAWCAVCGVRLVCRVACEGVSSYGRA